MMLPNTKSMKSILLLVIVGSVPIIFSGVTFNQSLLILAQLSSNDSNLTYPNNPTQTLSGISNMTNLENDSGIESTNNIPAPM